MISFPETSRKKSFSPGLYGAVIGGMFFIFWLFMPPISRADDTEIQNSQEMVSGIREKEAESGISEKMSPRGEDSEKTSSGKTREAETEAGKGKADIPSFADDELYPIPHVFRRVYLPRELMESIPGMGIPYWPVDAKKFEHWVTAVETKTVEKNKSEASLTADSAYYRATFEKNGLVNGLAAVTLKKNLRIPASGEKKTYSWRFSAGNFSLERIFGFRNIFADRENFLSKFPAESFNAESFFTELENFTGRKNLAETEKQETKKTEKIEKLAFFPDGTAEMVFPVSVKNTGENFPEEWLAFFVWSQKKNTSRGEEDLFDLRFFPAMNTTFDLLLPADKIPSASHGLTERLKTFPASGNGEPERVLWRFHFGGNHHVSLRITSPETAEVFYPLQISQENRYAFRKSGFSMCARMNVDSFRAGSPQESVESAESPKKTPEKLKIRVDSRISLISVTYNRTPVSWHFLPSEKNSADKNPAGNPSAENHFAGNMENENESAVDILLEIPQEIRGVGNILELRAVENPRRPWKMWPDFPGRPRDTASDTTKTADMPESTDAGERLSPKNADSFEENETDLPLPKIQILNAFWSEGKTVVRAVEPVQFLDVRPREGRILSSRREIPEPGNDAPASRILEIQEFSPDTSVSVKLAPIPVKITMHSVTVMDFQETEISALSEMVFSAEDGERFLILALTDPRWMIDSVESPDAGSLEDWDLDDTPESGPFISRLLERNPAARMYFEREKIMPALLKMNLSQALKPGYEISLRVRTRRLGPPGNRHFTAAELSPLWFPESMEGERWLLADSSFSWKLKLHGDYLEKLAAVKNAPSPLFFGNESAQNAVGMTGEPTRFSPAAVIPVTPTPTVSLPGISMPSASAPGISGPASILSTPHAGALPHADLKSADLKIGEKTLPTSLSPAAQKIFSRVEPLIKDHSLRIPLNPASGNTPILCVEPRTPAYDAVIEGFYDLESPASAQAVFMVECKPRNSSVEKISVYIRPATLFDISWKFPKLLEKSVTRRVEKIPLADEHSAGTSCEMWEISLESPQIHPFQFEIVLLPKKISPENAGDSVSPEQTETGKPVSPKLTATFRENHLSREISAENDFPEFISEFSPDIRKSSSKKVEAFRKLLDIFPGGIPLNLISLPEAEESSAVITLRRDTPGGLSIHPRRMTPVYSGADTAGISPTGILRSFQYSPRMLRSRIHAPELKISGQKADDQNILAWVWREEIQSQFFPGGLALHVISWKVENIGEKEFRVEMADAFNEDSHILGILVDGRRIPHSAWEDSPERVIRVPLPAWKRGTEISIQWVRKNSPLSVYSSLKIRRPKTNFPILNSTWKVWVPDNYILTDSLWNFTPYPAYAASGKPFPETESGGNGGNGKSGNENGEKNTSEAGNFVSGKNTQESEIARRQEEIQRKNSILYRFFGNMFYKSGFFASAPVTSSDFPENMMPEVAGKAFLVDNQQWLSLVAVSPKWDASEWELHAGWTPYTMQNTYSCRVFHSRTLEALRWFLLLLTFLLCISFFRKFHAAKIGLCGLSAAACLIFPPVTAPIFSGIFFGFILSFGFHSALRRRERLRERYPKVIHVFTPEKAEKISTKVGVPPTTAQTVDFIAPIHSAGGRGQGSGGNI